MGERSLRRLLSGGSFFEAPRWHDGRWWVSDFYRHTVQAVTPDGTAETVLEVPGQPSGLGWMPDGALIVVSMKDRRLLRRDASGAVELVADLRPWCGGHANDMVIDAAGRAYVGNFGFDFMGRDTPRTAGLVRVDPDGTVTPATDGLMFPNGMVITADGSTLVVAETLGARLSAFTVEDDGTLTDWRVWAQLAATPDHGSLREVLGALEVAPDGCTMDAEGHIWAADATGGRAIRVAPDGDIIDEIAPPGDLGVFACMLGGDQGDTLLLCTAPDFLEHRRAPAREAILWTTRVDVPHAGRP
jgi:sugar lactone lactonase YvrE